jgi:hypothetical protein
MSFYHTRNSDQTFKLVSKINSERYILTRNRLFWNFDL